MNQSQQIMESLGRVDEGSQPKDVLSIWDEGPDKTIDRYTIVLDPKQGWDKERNGDFQMIGLGPGGRGVSQFTSGQVGKHLGKKIKWADLDADTQKHIIGRLKDD
jgi:hypothetical protein